MSIKHTIFFVVLIGLVGSCKAVPQAMTTSPKAVTVEMVKDSLAEKMLLYQRSYGGWPQPGGNPVNYSLELSEATKAILQQDKNKPDATIDDNATTLEVKTLLKIYKKTNNPTYLKAAENGINYLLAAQNAAGGWGQFFPDTSGYHKHITYNDNAMIEVMWIMKNISEGAKDFETVDKKLISQATNALQRGIVCILKTQIVQNKILTAWCAQHDRVSLKPAKARAFELPSISGNESIGICLFLMSIDKPNNEVKTAIKAAVAYFETVKITGFKIQDIKDTTQPSGKDRVLVADPNAVIWARFYDLDTNKPFFTGRNSKPKTNLADIENERRIGYAFYGTWPAKLLANDYPKWLKKWGN